MKQINYSIKLLIALLFLTSTTSRAQLVGTEGFLQGDFVEVGIATNGAFGSGTDAPAGYHPRGVGNLLGFVADPAKDGWTVGTPNYIGDYFLPGSPHEGWDVQYEGIWAKAWRSSGATSFTGGLTGACTGYSVVGTKKIITWEGKTGPLTIRQVTTMRTDKIYFITKVTIKNTGSTTVNKIYYDRTVDPDNEVSTPGGGSFVTINKFEYLLPNKNFKTLVSGTGENLGAYLGLGTKDCRAKPYIVKGSLLPLDSPSVMFKENAKESATAHFSFELPDTALIADCGIGLMFNIGSLAPGDSTNVSYAYILGTPDLDTAFADISPEWLYEGTKYQSGDTVKICRTKGSPDEIKKLDLINASGFSWDWSPRPGMKNLTGTLNEITLTDKAVTYVAKAGESFGCIDSMMITIQPYVIPDAPSTVTPIYYCQYDAAVPLTATFSSAGSLRWYMTPTGGTPLMTLTPNVLATGSKIYYVSVLNGICESPRTPLQVITRAIPKLDNFTFTDPTYCGAKDGTITFTSDSANTTYTLTFDRNGVPATPLTITTDAAKSYTITGLYGGSYSTFVVTNKYGCKSSPYYGPVDLTDPRPPGPPITNNGPLCADATATFTVPFIAGAKYQWYGPDGFTSTDRNPTFTTTAKSGGSYRLEVSVDSCKYLPSFSILVITPTPQHQEFTPPYQLCENTDLVVEVLREPAVNYLWTGKGVTQLDQDLKLPSIQLAQSGQYILTSTSDNGCVTMDTITVAVDKRATFSMVSDTAICSVDSALLPVNSDAVKIRWTPTNGLSDSTSFNVKARPAATTTYTAVASPGNTCPDTSGSATVTIIPTPSVIGYDTLVRMNIPYVIMPTFGQEVVKWTWVPGDSLSCSDCPKPTFNSNKPMSYLVYGTNAEGCVGKDTVNIRVFCDGANVTMPNAFTPNNDGNNDIYYVRGTGFTVKSFTIFNRLGQEVFRKENFTPNDPSMGWDGTFGGQVISDAAGFVYMLEVVCFNSGYEPMIMKGTVLMIK